MVIGGVGSALGGPVEGADGDGGVDERHVEVALAVGAGVYVGVADVLGLEFFSGERPLAL